MSPAAFAEILGKIRGYTDYLSLHVLGEPLLHPNLGQLLATCKEQGLRVNLSTNATLLPECRSTLLNSAALRQINISLHSFEGQENGAALESYLATILEFIREASAGTPLFISLRLWNLMPETNSTERRRNHLFLEKLESFFSLPYRIADELTPGHGITLAPRVFLSLAPRFTWPHAPGPDLGSQGFCHGLRDHVAILVDGTVVPCCLDAEADIPLGNIYQQPFARILAGERSSLIRQGFSRRQVVEALCRRCSFRQAF